MGALERTVGDIKTMRIRGANEIAIAGLNVLRDIAEKEGFGRKFNRACNLLLKTRPTAVPLSNSIEIVKKEKKLERLEKMIFYLENIGDVIGFLNYKIIKRGTTILTHCHSKDVVNFLRRAKEKKKKFNVIVTETRPLYQGIKTAGELSDVGIPVTYIIDSAAGFFSKDIDLMIFGCDAIRKEGVVNKIGTYPLAVLAKENRIPVYFVGGTIKFDRRKKFKIEERRSDEVINRKKLKKCKIRNPAFDVTPWKFIKGVITEKGVLKPRQVLRMLK